MAEERDPDAVDLGISAESVAIIVDQMRGLQIRELPDSAAAEEDQDSEAALLTHEPGDATLGVLRNFIRGLNVDEQVSLVALAWIGRGDFEPEQWQEARRLAAERDATGRDVADYLLDMDELADLLSDGAAALGFPLEDVAR